MLNYLWGGMILIGIITGFLSGKIDEVTKALIDSSSAAVQLSIGLLGVLCFWTGIMEIASQSGLVRGIANVIKPLTRFLFPGVPKGHPALAAMVMNMVANFLGLGNAATPLGLKAMGELQKINKNKNEATNDMCMFLIINTTSIQLIPATLIALRSAAGSTNPTKIISAVWITSLCTVTTGILIGKLFASRKEKSKA